MALTTSESVWKNEWRLAYCLPGMAALDDVNSHLYNYVETLYVTSLH